jgi:hypothetical protein
MLSSEMPQACNREMTIEERREILAKQAWLANVKRVLGFTDNQAICAWVKIENAKLKP